MIRCINIALLVVALCGAVVAVREGRLRRELLAEHQMLANETGYLDIVDPSKAHVVALPSDDPLHFRWRIHLPAKYEALWRTSEWGRDASGTTVQAESFIAQVRFRKNEFGFVRVFSDMKVGGVSSVGGRELQAFLSDKWDQIERVQLGVGGQVVVEPDQVATLLQLRMPEAMAREAKSVLPAPWGSNYIPVLYEVQFGTKGAWDAVDDSEATLRTRGGR